MVNVICKGYSRGNPTYGIGKGSNLIKRGRRRRATIPIQNKHHIKEFLDVGYNIQGVFI